MSDTPIADDLIDELVATAVGNILPVPIYPAWRTIETLDPRDEDGPQVHIILWNGEDVTVGVRESEYTFGDALWIDRDGDMNPVSPQPTHWMPLPAPPQVPSNTLG